MSNNEIASVSMMGFGDEASAERYMQQRDAARRAQRVPYAIAPGASIEVVGGRRLTEGQEIRLPDLADGSGVPSWQRMHELVESGVVLFADEFIVRANNTSPDAPFRVAPGRQSVCTNRGILAPGEEIRPEDVGDIDGIIRLIGLGLVVARDGVPKPSSSTSTSTSMPRGASRKGAPDAA